MTTIDKQTRLLNDLILINNDRVVGYQKAIEELKKDATDLKLLFEKKIEQSQKFTKELTNIIIEAGKKVEKGTTNAGKIYRVWMDVKAFLGGFHREIVLDNCIDGEDAAIQAYSDVLTSEGLDSEVRSLLTQHHADLITSFNSMKTLKKRQTKSK